jgi:hypothetical protein
MHGEKNPALRACITSSKIFHAVRAGFLQFCERVTFACSEGRKIQNGSILFIPVQLFKMMFFEGK